VNSTFTKEMKNGSTIINKKFLKHFQYFETLSQESKLVTKLLKQNNDGMVLLPPFFYLLLTNLKINKSLKERREGI
jgi:hypothetical protein